MRVFYLISLVVLAQNSFKAKPDRDMPIMQAIVFLFIFLWAEYLYRLSCTAGEKLRLQHSCRISRH